MNRFLVVLFTFLLINTIGYSFASDKHLISDSKRPILRAPQTPAWSDWSNCRKAATAGVARAIAKWQSQAVLKDVVINGPEASGDSVTGPLLHPSIERSMTEAGVPMAVANAFASSVSNAWSMWASSLRVPGLPWYPMFAQVCGTELAPTIPNVPTQLATLVGNPEPLLPHRLKASISSALGIRVKDPKASAAINAFADDFASRFTKYLASVKVTNVMGTGPVPGLTNLIPCGRVIGGKGTMKAGGFVGTWPAN